MTTARNGVSQPPDSAAVRAHLRRLLDSKEFERAGRVRLLLDFLVNQVLDGRGADLKESLIGVRVFERDPVYDPKIDPVVRVTVGRLRGKLERYYEREGSAEPLRISVAK